MFGLNNAQLIGRLGADVTVSNLANGGKVANLSIATDESYIDRNSGDRVDRTEWHRVVTFQPGLVYITAISTRISHKLGGFLRYFPLILSAIKEGF